MSKERDAVYWVISYYIGDKGPKIRMGGNYRRRMGAMADAVKMRKAGIIPHDALFVVEKMPLL